MEHTKPTMSQDTPSPRHPLANTITWTEAVATYRGCPSDALSGQLGAAAPCNNSCPQWLLCRQCVRGNSELSCLAST